MRITRIVGLRRPFGGGALIPPRFFPKHYRSTVDPPAGRPDPLYARAVRQGGRASPFRSTVDPLAGRPDPLYGKVLPA